MAQDIIAGVSNIDKQFKMMIIYRSHPKYKHFEPFFKQHGYAFLQIPANTIWIDGQAIESLSKDQFLAIQAHEIAHSVLQHKGHYTAVQEREADVAGIAILNALKYDKASKILKDRAVQAYGQSNLTLHKQQLAKIKQYITEPMSRISR